MKLILGTAQLGMKYGINNNSNNQDQAVPILKTALQHNITHFDTARDYGTSESVLGSYINQTTKGKSTVIITKLTHQLDEANLVESINQSISDSLKNLNKSYLDVLLLHRWEHRFIQDGLVWNQLKFLREQDLIKDLGVSVYHLDEAIECLKDDDIKYLQIPFNIIDRRWDDPEFMSLVEKRKEVKIFVRSIFLQGLLISNDINIWKKVGVDSDTINFYISNLQSLSNKFKKDNIADLAISYVKSIEWIDGIIFGVDLVDQLLENINLFNQSDSLTTEQLAEVRQTFHQIDLQLLNPCNWSINR